MRADQDTVLARRAAAGDGAAFATLYDRHERRAYNLCYRITGSAEDAADATQQTFLNVLERLPSMADRELNFGSYLLTAARHASYDAMARHRRAAPAAEIPDSALPPAAAADEPALRAAHQEQILAANAQLPPRQREVLALRELEELSYDEVAEIMGMNRNSVAQLISRARLNLRDGLRRGALGSIPAGSPDCEAALPLLALAQDNGLDGAARADWLAGHLAGCATCRVRIEAMEEAGAAYRLWLPLVPALWLRGEAVAHAAERTRAPGHAFHRRRLAAVAGAGVALLVGAGLVAAEVVQAPVRPAIARSAAPIVLAIPTPTPTPAPARHPVRRRHAKPEPAPRDVRRRQSSRQRRRLRRRRRHRCGSHPSRARSRRRMRGPHPRMSPTSPPSSGRPLRLPIPSSRIRRRPTTRQTRIRRRRVGRRRPARCARCRDRSRLPFPERR
jgi:RNA polymerase sigma factor (sigma-70 family)